MLVCVCFFVRSDDEMKDFLPDDLYIEKLKKSYLQITIICLPFLSAGKICRTRVK